MKEEKPQYLYGAVPTAAFSTLEVLENMSFGANYPPDKDPYLSNARKKGKIKATRTARKRK